MKKLLSATKTILVISAIAAAAVGCKPKTTTAPVDTAATTTTPATTTAATGPGANYKADATAPSHTSAGAGNTAMGSSHGGMTGAGSGGDDTSKARPAVRNNTGETQGTTPNTSLPVSDGSR